LGHDIGDKVLIKVADRINSCIDKGDIVFRLGEDEFIVLTFNIDNEYKVRDYANKIINEISKPLFINNFDIKTSASIGIVMYPKDDITFEGLLRKADATLYEVKEKEKGGFLFFSQEIEEKNIKFREIETGLRRALVNNELCLYIQPIFRESNNGEFVITKGELLLRWIRNNRIVYSPDEFIKVAEENGMIVDVGNWIMKEAYRIRRKLIENGIDIDLCINISAKQLENKDFLNNIKYLLGEKNILENWIFEITENVLIKDFNISTHIFKEVKKLGIKIALDDFGTGYSSINYLSQLPIDYIKIDRSFISKAGQDGFNGVILAITSMAKSLGVKTVAEGVENKEQLKLLRTLGCDEFQGYFFSKPIDVEEFIRNLNLLNKIKI